MGRWETLFTGAAFKKTGSQKSLIDSKETNDLLLVRTIFAGMQDQRFTPQQAVPKIKQYCAYQERCHSEVKEKLYGYGLNKNEVEELIARLIEENYLNEERFALLFAGGKFRIKQWGRIKIRQALKQKQVSDYCIKKALADIDPDAYENTLSRLADSKFKTLQREKNVFVKRKKLQDHLRLKGYENDLVNSAVAKLMK